MAKFYCISGPFRTIVDATDCDTAARKTVHRLIQTGSPHGFLLAMNECGFNHPKGVVCSLIPFMRAEGVPLPPDDVIIESACEWLGVSHLNEANQHWLLYGER